MLSKIINEHLLKYRAEEEPRHYIGASGVGHMCSRKIWYDYNSPELAAPFTAQQLMTFEIGKALEEKITNLLMNGLYFERGHFYILCFNGKPKQISSANLEIQGTPDLYLKKPDNSELIIEIKTANNTSFNEFKKHGLKLWRPQYYSQLQCYLGMTRIRKGILLCINKNTSEMHEEEVEFEEMHYKALLTKAKYIKEATTPPERVARTPMSPVCKMCNYKDACWNG